MRIFTRRDIEQIDRQTIRGAIESAYRKMLSGKYHMPDRMHVPDNGNTLLLMPCFSNDFFSTKLVSVFPDAPAYDQPVVNGILVLNDNTTGRPLAVFDGAAVTAQRTGAVGGLAVELLSHENVRSAGVFGAGVQGYQQARYALLNRQIESLLICDLSQSAAERMAKNLKQEFADIRVSIEHEPDVLVKQSDIIIAATTSATPLFEANGIDITGKIFISIGSYTPQMQEFPGVVSEKSDVVFVDTMFACSESGDLANPLKKKILGKEKIREFASLLDEPPRLPDQTVFFKSVGMALFDLAAAQHVYAASDDLKIGRTIEW